MESVFTSNRERLKGRMKPRVCGLLLLTAIILYMLPAGKLMVYASKGNDISCCIEPQADLALMQGDLDFSQGTDLGDLENDGYQWQDSSKTLKLKNANITSTVTLPDDTVTIEITGDCFIDMLAIVSDPNRTNLTFTGNGKLTVEKTISIVGGDNNAIHVAKGVYVVANSGIDIGASGGTNSVVTVEGTLTAKGTTAISAGKVVIKDGGLLDVSGKKGVQLNGMTNGGTGYDVTGVFTVEKGGCLIANCESFNVRVVSITGTFPTGSTAEQAIKILEGYLPTDCGLKLEGGEINLIRKSTGEVYNNAIIIHENHRWPEEWNGKDETGHWKECTYEGCDKTTGYEAHSYDSNTWKCVCGSTLAVNLDGAEGLSYNGKEHKPGVTVIVDGNEPDASKYNVAYSNNRNAGEASVIVTGKDGFNFNVTLNFKIAKIKPTITWSDTVQTVTCSGGQTTIAPPIVTLLNGEIFDGEIHYSYAAKGSGDYTDGLPTDAGVYTVKASIAEQENYTAADSTNTLTLTVERAKDASSGSTNITGGSKKEEEEKPPVLSFGGHAVSKNVIRRLPQLPHIHSYSETEVKEATCTKSGIVTYSCSCGVSYMKSIPALGHSYTSSLTQEPTAAGEGVMTYTCTRCGDTYTEPVERLKVTPSELKAPVENEQTRSPWWLLVAVLLLLFLGIGGIFFAKRRKGKQDT